MKENYTFCVDEKMTEAGFVTDLFVSYFQETRGCSWINAISWADQYLHDLYLERSGNTMHRDPYHSDNYQAI